MERYSDGNFQTHDDPSSDTSTRKRAHVPRIDTDIYHPHNTPTRDLQHIRSTPMDAKASPTLAAMQAQPCTALQDARVLRKVRLGPGARARAHRRLVSADSPYAPTCDPDRYQHCSGMAMTWTFGSCMLMSAQGRLFTTLTYYLLTPLHTDHSK